MAYVVFFTLALLITILSVYLVIENNRRKAREAEKKAFNDRLKVISSNFKLKVAEFVEAKILRPKYAPQINAIVGNFFVVQAHSEENLAQLEKVSELFIYSVTNELNKCRSNGNMDLLAEQLQYFVAELPTAGIAYNRDFYREMLPALIARIQTPDTPAIQQDEDVLDSQELGDSEPSNQQMQAALVKEHAIG
ncbi:MULTISPECIES: hypothetical protein [Pseudoalteromonas]|uniref:hypothetical protein n=1 Tax=Pseudoalteromonas TaxID=53246 RepID=UPI00057E2C97|nr:MULTISPECIES: hypothetical protein [Pseudoalteromonas]KID38071.1 hypothetical protein QT15_04705 [Pseudoalteromonas flavipulchra NCIMB 2033 = ATCC BAA-314]MBD0782760.1 hypothetical protein [Pseudoalteromonas flavipulchra]MBE0372348.1 hypothetical protein [Pseudoalteromonas flavipulchra NCIMB 2033 = ATCC BAA-314]MCF7515110.1 hypothetical protein [Pseudoalteromonas sp. L7]MCF7526966.1 hypothetical protein [Pseudoalteromonas sp. L23]